MSRLPLTVYCNGCSWKLCERCSRTHQEIPGGAHQVVQFGSTIKEDILKLKGSLCTVHPGDNLELHGVTCHMDIYQTCIVMEHKKHICRDIIDIYKTFIQTLSLDVEQVAAKEFIFSPRSKTLRVRTEKLLSWS